MVCSHPGSALHDQRHSLTGAYVKVSTVTQVVSDDQILTSVLQRAQIPLQPKKRRRTRQIIDWKTPGFGPKARVLTSFGQLPVEALRRNDPVKTASGDYLKVAWTDSFGLDAEFLSLQPQAHAVLVPAGTFAPSRPERDTLFSPAQSLHIGPSVGSGAVKNAQDLIGWARISRASNTTFTYHVFGFETDCTVCVEGLWCDMPARPNNV